MSPKRDALPLSVPMFAAATWIGTRSRPALVDCWLRSSQLNIVSQNERCVRATTLVMDEFIEQSGNEWLTPPATSLALLFQAICSGHVIATALDLHPLSGWGRTTLQDIRWCKLSRDGSSLGKQEKIDWETLSIVEADAWEPRYADVLVDTQSLFIAYPEFQTADVERSNSRDRTAVKVKHHELIIAFWKEFPDGKVPTGPSRKQIYAAVVQHCVKKTYCEKTLQTHLKALIDEGQSAEATGNYRRFRATGADQDS